MLLFSLLPAVQRFAMVYSSKIPAVYIRFLCSLILIFAMNFNITGKNIVVELSFLNYIADMELYCVKEE